jgi:hypothetical protein
MRPVAPGLVWLLLPGLLGLSAPAAAATTLYRWVDADGVLHYSDTPFPGAQKIELSDAQTYHGPPPAAPAVAAPPAAASPYQSCDITQPASQSSLFAPESVDISVALSPGLRPGDQLSVAVDGQALQPVSAGGSTFQLSQPDRGTHTLTAEVRGPDGTVLCSAPSVVFAVQRPSVNSPQSPVRPH